MSSSVFPLLDNQKVPYQIIGDDAAGFPGAQLPAGASLAVSSSDPTIASVVPDAAPAPGTIASGYVVAATPAKLGQVQISAAVTNADGSAGPTGSVSVNVSAGSLSTIVMNLGTPVSQ